MAERIREGVDVAPVPLRLVLGSQALARLLAGPATRALHATRALVVIGVDDHARHCWADIERFCKGHPALAT